MNTHRSEGCPSGNAFDEDPVARVVSHLISQSHLLLDDIMYLLEQRGLVARNSSAGERYLSLTFSALRESNMNIVAYLVESMGSMNADSVAAARELQKAFHLADTCSTHCRGLLSKDPDVVIDAAQQLGELYSRASDCLGDLRSAYSNWIGDAVVSSSILDAIYRIGSA